MKTLKYILSSAIIGLFISCSSETTSVTEEKIESNNIEITKTQFEYGKMELGTFSNQLFHKAVEATGMLDVPPENKATVSAYFGGYVKHLSLLQGQHVTKGQTLLTLENPQYVQVQQDFLETKSRLSYLKSDYERQKDLAADNVSSKKIFLKAESDYNVALAQFESLKKKLELMNISPSSIAAGNLRTTIVVTAPISGFVTSVLATKGMFLNPSDIAVTIMNTDHMHVELNIYEQDLARVSIGQEVSFRLQNDDQKYNGTVHLINKAIDPDNRSIKVHCHLSNEKDALKLTPGMYVEAEIYTSSDTTLALPSSAVISVENKNFALIRKGKSSEPYHFIRKEVIIGETNNDYIEIKNADTFNMNEDVLTKGAFNLIQE